MGKNWFVHSNPINLFLNVIGLVPLIAGIWAHSTELVLVAFSIIIAGHFYGWDEIHSSLKIH